MNRAIGDGTRRSTFCPSTPPPLPPSPTVAAIWRAREAEAAADPRSGYEGYGISASALGTSCDRQIWLTLRWASPPETPTGRQLRILERGDIEEEPCSPIFDGPGIEISREQERFALASGWLRGKVDAVGGGFLEAPKAEHVVEIKSMKAADWRAVQKHGMAKAKPEHWHPLHTGMAALGIARGAYVATNSAPEELLVERIRLDVEEANRQEARVERLVAEHDAPLRIADNAERPPCRFCRHKALCFDAAMPRRHCRTCLHFAFGRDGAGHCMRFAEPRSPQRQQEGRDCPTHLFLPALVPGEQVDADPEAETVTYRLPRRDRLDRWPHRGSSMTEDELGRWVSGAERGESFAYAVASAGVVQSPEENQMRRRIMKAARRLHEKGLVALVQRRASSSRRILYVAQRTWKKDGDK